MSSLRGGPRAASASLSATSSSLGGPGKPRPNAFPKARRLRTRAQFRAVYDGGVRAGSGLLTVFALKAGAVRPARVGLTVTRRVGNAVVRNRAKRALREAMRRHWRALPNSLDVVLHAKPRIRRATSGEVEQDVLRALRRAVHRAGRR
ncbi:MAG: ribonuclease P protein component [Bryobacterales bacterium]|nr:ribonuclease P protein component [Bryobacterales bacterium]